ncbi:hypothetical protein [Pseudomonas sp.]|uniref:hypothetical protein n=1 Tax=Pseudomonas sp. TaxID=306 RepID=UPI00273193AF|nr:hypothetical protein [Pseudomonas sp.]MDP2244986.1 hypothetical protein [Pseudomonas sp.]
MKKIDIFFNDVINYKFFMLMNREYITIFLSVFILFLLISFISGYIPVSDGAGWDGSIYYNYAQILAAGGDISGDPYREIRMPAFFPIILAIKFGANHSQIIIIQAILNSILLAASASLLYATFLELGLQKKISILSLAALILTWPFIVMPVFYPILSDHAALATSCLCLWCWSKSQRWALCVISAASLWIIPGSFLIPLILSAFPLRAQGAQAVPRYKYRISARILATVLISISIFFFIVPYLLSIPQDKILAHATDKDGVTALMELRSLSLLSISAAVLFVVWIYISILTNINTWKAVSYKYLTLSFVATLSSAYFMYSCIDWSSGFAGPPLFLNMALQSLALPFKPLVSHFLNLTPTIIPALIVVAKYSFGGQKNTPIGLLVIFSAFIPFLLFGSESRQWIGVLPILVTIFAMSEFSYAQRKWCLLVSIALISPLLWLNKKTITALQSGASFQSDEWQFYFGRQGPWMSIDSYEIGLASIAVFIAGHLLFSTYSLKNYPLKIW